MSKQKVEGVLKRHIDRLAELLRVEEPNVAAVTQKYRTALNMTRNRSKVEELLPSDLVPVLRELLGSPDGRAQLAA